MRNLDAFGFVLAFLLGLLLLAVALIIGLIGAAAIFPRGHPTADRLREWANQIPRLALLSLGLFDVGAAWLILAGFVILTLIYS
mgnify:CR=1 FL=1